MIINIKIFISFLIVLLILPISFEFLNKYRNAKLQDNLSIYEFYEQNKNQINYVDNFTNSNPFIKRVDYHRIIAIVIKNDPLYVSKPFNPYLNNIIGLVPRFLWNDKPRTVLNKNLIGRELGILSPKNYSTSVGLSIIGESYYFYSYKGLIYISIFCALLIIIMIKLFNNNNFLSSFFLIFFGLEFALADGLTAFIPGILKYLIIFFPLVIFLNFSYEKKY